ncbi:MAG TPA: sensor histidine kinase [Vicinamibacterales bacterium]|nr:sensor histidine kinase [Vicinamibacterales bacterium]
MAAPDPYRPRSNGSRGAARRPRAVASEDLQNALRQLAAASEAAREEERGRIARELHDELGQLLTGLKFDISWLAAELAHTPGQPTVAIANKLQAMAGLVEVAIKSTQQIASELRPPALDHFGLAEALQWEAAMFEQRTGIRCRVSARTAGHLAPDRATSVFRIFQEALTNVARHAGAGAVRVSLRETRHDLVVDVRDNGRGITPRAVSDPASTGLLGMQERTRLLGGTLQIAGTPGRGTRVLLRVPR